MSRYEVRLHGHLVVVGWDRPLSTFFGQVFPPEAVVREARAIEEGRGRELRAAVQCERCEAVAVVTVPRADVELTCRVCGVGRLAGPAGFHPEDLDTGVSIRWVGMMDAIPSIDALASELGVPWSGVLDEQLRRRLHADANA